MITEEITTNTSRSSFNCSYSPGIPELLHRLGCSMTISTYQAGKVIFLSAKDENHLIQLPRTFRRPMGIALKDRKMAIATKDEIVVLANDPRLGITYPKQPQTYDALYMPRASYYTGHIDVHDLHWIGDQLWGINTYFSCLVSIDHEFSWTPRWKPSFITDLVSEDRCHLNGMAVQDRRPKYVSALGKGNIKQSWRDNITQGGVVFDLDSDEIILSGLAMPHSPRVINGELYLLLTATGEIVKADPQTGKYEVINQINAFIRGMAFHHNFLFVGFSRLRKDSTTFKHLEIAKKADEAGIAVFHLPSGNLMGKIIYQDGVDEIYDVQVLANCKRPGILNHYDPAHQLGLSIPQDTYWAKDRFKDQE